jgi:hypothetical protein
VWFMADLAWFWLEMAFWEDYGKKSMQIYSRRDLAWCDHSLRLRSPRGRMLATIEPDQTWPKMWRVRISGRLTDMVNLTRAKDAAACLALVDLNTQETPAEAPRIRYSEGAATSVALST